MKRRLYPVSRVDRIVFWMNIANALITPVYVVIGNYRLATASGAMAVVGLFLVYLLQDQPTDSDSERYSVMIDEIKAIATRLSSLNEFLERERKRVADAESTLQRLHLERAALEPVVATQRETVEAILATHAAKHASRAWKERTIGFLGGLFASLLAAVIHDVLRR